MGLHYPRICDGLFPSYKGNSHLLILPQLQLTTTSSQYYHNAGGPINLLQNRMITLPLFSWIFCCAQCWRLVCAAELQEQGIGRVGWPKSEIKIDLSNQYPNDNFLLKTCFIWSVSLVCMTKKFQPFCKKI